MVGFVGFSITDSNGFKLLLLNFRASKALRKAEAYGAMCSLKASKLYPTRAPQQYSIKKFLIVGAGRFSHIMSKNGFGVGSLKVGTVINTLLIIM